MAGLFLREIDDAGKSAQRESNSETVALRHPVMPVTDSFSGGFVWVARGELGERGGHGSALPSDNNEHVVLADFVRRHAHDLHSFPFPERRDDLRSKALRLQRETDLAFQI